MSQYSRNYAPNAPYMAYPEEPTNRPQRVPRREVPQAWPNVNQQAWEYQQIQQHYVVPNSNVYGGVTAAPGPSYPQQTVPLAPGQGYQVQSGHHHSWSESSQFSNYSSPELQYQHALAQTSGPIDAYYPTTHPAHSPTKGVRPATAQPAQTNADYSVPCPYGCGTVLTGVHAIGNLTRHLKSQNCTASGKTKTKYTCPLPGCDRQYTRSDGLKVHLRRRHDIPPSEGAAAAAEEKYYS